jgi:hypothetical protein
VGLCCYSEEGHGGKEVVMRRSRQSHLRSAKVRDGWKPGTTTKPVADQNNRIGRSRY